MFLYTNVGDLAEFWRRFEALYGDDAMVVAKKWFSTEDFYEHSCKQKKVAQYFFAFHLGYLLFIEVMQNPTKTWEELEVEYDLDTKRRNLKCHAIDLDSVLAIFNLPVNTSDGIEGIGVEDSFEVEPDSEAVVYSYNFAELLENIGTHTCINPLEC